MLPRLLLLPLLALGVVVISPRTTNWKEIHMATLPASTNANIRATTRPLWDRTVQHEVMRGIPLYNAFLMKNRVTFDGGTVLKKTVDRDEMDDLAQSYTAGTPLRGGRKTTLDVPYFDLKKINMPISYDVDEFLQNRGGPDTEIINFSQYLVGKAQRGMKLKLYRAMYETIGATPTSSTDDGIEVQGIRQALTHDAQYGHLTRTIGSEIKTWWQGASLDETYTDQGTANSASIDTFRKAVNAVSIYMQKTNDYICVVGPAIHLTLKTWVEAKQGYRAPDGPSVKFGFNSFMLDGVEVINDPFLRNSNITNSHKWFFLLNMSTWEFRINPERALVMTPFKWQGDKVNGFDEWLARILFAGNLVCWAPNANIYLSNVTA